MAEQPTAAAAFKPNCSVWLELPLIENGDSANLTEEDLASYAAANKVDSVTRYVELPDTVGAQPNPIKPHMTVFYIGQLNDFCFSVVLGAAYELRLADRMAALTTVDQTTKRLEVPFEGGHLAIRFDLPKLSALQRVIDEFFDRLHYALIVGGQGLVIPNMKTLRGVNPYDQPLTPHMTLFEHAAPGEFPDWETKAAASKKLAVAHATQLVDMDRIDATEALIAKKIVFGRLRLVRKKGTVLEAFEL